MTDHTIKHPALLKGYLDYDHLLGQEFIHGVKDCYAILQKLFKHNLDINLSNYARPDGWWVKEGMDLYKDNYMHEGFGLVELDNLSGIRILDVFLIAIPDLSNLGHSVTNHCAIYVGNGNIIHHRYGKLSQKVPYRGMMKNFTTAIIRHKDVPDLQSREELALDIMDYILPHKKEMLGLGVTNDLKRK